MKSNKTKKSWKQFQKPINKSEEKHTNKRKRIPNGQSNMDNPEKLANKRQRIPNGQSNMDNPEKLTNKR